MPTTRVRRLGQGMSWESAVRGVTLTRCYAAAQWRSAQPGERHANCQLGHRDEQTAAARSLAHCGGLQPARKFDFGASASRRGWRRTASCAAGHRSPRCQASVPIVGPAGNKARLNVA